MQVKNISKPWYLRLVSRSPRLYKLANFINSKVLSRAGVIIVSTYSLWKLRLSYFERLLSLVENVEGDIVECGVWKGESLGCLAFLNSKRAKKRHIWGFDSFEGLPAPSKEDISSPTSIAKKGMFSDASEATVLNKLRAVGVDEYDIESQITLVKGWFSDTLPKYNGSIALLHLDADLYDSTKCVLENLWHKVAVDGVVVLDNYHEEHAWPGERKAVDEFFDLHNEDAKIKMHKDLVFERYYIIKVW